MITLDYVAGFTDGEGHIGIGARSVRIIWGQKDVEILHQLQSWLEKIGISPRLYRIGPKLPHRPNAIFMLHVNRREDCRSLCSKLLPLLVVKFKDCQRAIEWMDNHPMKINNKPVNEAEVRRLHALGFTGVSICKQLNISRGKFDRATRQLGMVFKPGGRTISGVRLRARTSIEHLAHRKLVEKSKQCSCGKQIYCHSQRCKSCAQKQRHLEKPKSFKTSSMKSVRSVTDQFEAAERV